METLFEDESGKVSYDRARRVILIARTATPLTPAQLGTLLAKATAAIERRLAGEPRADHGVVIDLRQVRAKGDDSAADAGREGLAALRPHFARQVMLVATAAGYLQVKRLAREGGAEANVTLDEAEALAFAAGEVSRLRPITG